MSNSNGKITAPVSTDDVCSVLGVSNHNVGYLCGNPHGQINKWARYKPVCHKNLDSVNGVTNKGYKSDYGITPPQVCSSAIDFVNNLNAAASQWIYQPPIGGEYPYRLTDFDGYDHNARNPFGQIPEDLEIFQNNNGFTIDCLTPMSNSAWLSLSDFTSGEYNYKEWYFGLIIKSGNTIMWRTSEHPLSKIGAYMVVFNEKFPTTGAAEIYPFLTNGSNTTGTSSATKFIGIESKGDLVNIRADGVYVAIKAYISGTALKCEVTFKNNTTSSKTFSGVLLGSTDNSSAGITIQSGISVAVGANSEVVKTYSINTTAYKFVKFQGSAGTGFDPTTRWIGIMSGQPGTII